LVTALIIRVTPFFATTFGATGAFARIVTVSLLFFTLYLAGVILLHKGMRPLSETVGLIHELLPARTAISAMTVEVDT